MRGTGGCPPSHRSLVAATGLLVLAVAATAGPVNPSAVSATTVPAPTWTRSNDGGPTVDGAAIAYDSLHHQYVALDTGGTTWTGDGAIWLRRSPAHSPGARAFASMAFDGGEVTLFGGTTGGGETTGTALEDTWTWDGTDWAQLSPTATHPLGRYAASMARDPQSSSVVLVGGIAPSQEPCSTFNTAASAPPIGISKACSDPTTWVWSAQTRSWTQYAVPGPTPRYAASMASDPVSRRLILFGGGDPNRPDVGNDFCACGSPVLGDTWAWDGSTHLWTVLAAAGGPPARRWAGMASDSQGVVLFGGDTGLSAAGDNFLGDTWHWEGRAWVQRSPAPAPSARKRPELATAEGGGALLFGGIGCRGGQLSCSPAFNVPAADTTWAWDGAGWSWSPAAPLARDLAAAAYDPVSQRTLIFGGRTATDSFIGGSLTLGDAATWDGAAWSPVAGGPPSRFGAAAAFDAATGKVVLFGGQSQSDTWSWDGSTSTWTHLRPAHSPSLMAGLAMAYDSAHQQIVVFGEDTSGAHLAQTWTWNGTDWSQVNPTVSPPARAFGSMTYDSLHQQLVLFGGIDPDHLVLKDTWTWDGSSSSWTEHTQPVPPQARSGASLAFDAAAGRSILFGGAAGAAQDQLLGDTWAWDGSTSTWSQLGPAATPSARFGGALTYDTTRQRLTLIGGSTSPLPMNPLENDFANDTWTFDPAATPAALALLLSPSTVDFGAQPAGRLSLPRLVAVSNTGSSPLAISRAAITAGSSDYSASTDCPTSLPSGSSCGVMVSFRPSALGTRSGTLSITDGAPGSPQTVGLTGTGLAVSSGDAAALYLQGVTLFAGSAPQRLPDGGQGLCEAGPVVATAASTTSATGVPGCQTALGPATLAAESVSTGPLAASAHSSLASLALLPGLGPGGSDLLDVNGLEATSASSCSSGQRSSGSSSIARLLVDGIAVATRPVGSQLVLNPTGGRLGSPGYIRVYGSPLRINPTGGRIPMAIVTLNYSRYDLANNTEVSSPLAVEFPPGGPLSSLIVGRVLIGYASSGVHPCR